MSCIKQLMAFRPQKGRLRFFEHFEKEYLHVFALILEFLRDIRAKELSRKSLKNKWQK